MGPWLVQPAMNRVLRGSRSFHVTPKSMEVLVCLAKRNGQVVRRDELFHEVWPGVNVTDDAPTKCIGELRRALHTAGGRERPVIETIAKRGYRIAAPVSWDASAGPGSAGSSAGAVTEKPGSATLPTHSRIPGRESDGTALVRVRRRYSAVVITAAGTLIAITAVIWHTDQGRLFPQFVPEPVLLTGYVGTKSEPAFSPDGSRVAFAWDGPKQDNTDIYVTQVGASEPIRLTSDPAVEHAPAWSPDGRSILFLRQFSDRRTGVFLIPATGGPASKIAELSPHKAEQHLSARPCWHPGGRWLFISEASTEGEAAALFLLSIESGEKRRLTSPPRNTRGDLWPAISPDGHLLVFVRAFGSYHQDLYAVALSDDLRPIGDPKRMTSAKPFNRQPAWSADGRSIVFVSGDSPHHPSLWRMVPATALGQTASLEALPLPDANWPAMSRQGRLVYGRRVWDFDIWRLELGGGRRERLPSNSSRLEHMPQYSPDGNRIAFASDRSGSHELWTCGSDGSNPVKLTSFGGPYVSSPVWSPDGRRLAFFVRLDGEHDDVYLLDSDGGKPEHLIRGSGATWSRDGRWIYFGDDSQIWKVPVAGGPQLQVTKAGGDWGLESTDGRFLYYLLNNAVWRVPTAGGEATQLIPSVYPQFFEVVEQGIYFTTASPRPAITFFCFKTGKTQKVAEYDESGSSLISEAVGWGLSASPDRRSLLFSKREDKAVDLMLVENFR